MDRSDLTILVEFLRTPAEILLVFILVASESWALAVTALESNVDHFAAPVFGGLVGGIVAVASIASIAVRIPRANGTVSLERVSSDNTVLATLGIGNKYGDGKFDPLMVTPILPEGTYVRVCDSKRGPSKDERLAPSHNALRLGGPVQKSEYLVREPRMEAGDSFVYWFLLTPPKNVAG